ncbi:MAG: hypothetical protein HY046_03580 [Acidobacteria bacterium]|nr:hypothetical protein [Acidobacteriota bacterium]
MTVCIAGIHQNGKESCIILACDRKITFLNGWCSGDDIADKLVRVNDDWVVMISGEVSPMVPIVESLKEKLNKVHCHPIRSFARLCSKTYQDERRNVIENEILTDFGLSSYDEYVGLKTGNEQLFNSITEIIKEKEEGWNLLFAGFDEGMEPHLFVIGERGKIQYCDMTGFAAIGAGQLTALVYMSSCKFNRHLDIEE